MSNICHFNEALEKTAANHVPLSPLSFIRRTAAVYPDRTALVYNESRYSWQQTYARCCQLASLLTHLGIHKGDTVAVMLPNVPAMYEAHFGIPMVGAVLNAINIRLDPEAVAFILQHSRSRLLLVDPEYVDVVEKALAQLEGPAPQVINVSDPSQGEERWIGGLEYEVLLTNQPARYDWQLPDDEWDAIALGYTSGTTGNPKGVVSHHRGAYLNAVSNALSWTLPANVIYLWTLPMFHCNGWCFPWTLSAIIGTHVCLRQVRAAPIWRALAEEGVTHLCGAPIVMSLIESAPEDEKRHLDRRVQFFTAAAPPPEKLLASMDAAGFDVTHLYGLTETYGPAVVNEWHSDWSALAGAEQARLKARQGVRYLPLEGLTVLDPETMQPVPHDGETIGEVMFRGNVVMKGYFRNPEATQKALADGWFHSGDLGVIHPDGYIQLKDRSKDIIISGGENISSIEVEEALYRHPAISVVAVVAMPHETWGETPCAFVELKSGQVVDEIALHNWCREHLATYKVPRKFMFEAIPRTSTGKIQKYVLRQRASELSV